MKAVRPVFSYGVPYLQMSSVGSHSSSGRKKKGKKERTRSYKGHNDYDIVDSYPDYSGSNPFIDNMHLGGV